MTVQEEVADTPLVPSLHDREAEAGLATKERILNSPYSGARRPTPWYRTRKWVIILLILGVVIVAAVVGGAVGGTVGHHKNNNNSSNSTSPTNSTSSSIPISAPLTVAGSDGGVGGASESTPVAAPIQSGAGNTGNAGDTPAPSSGGAIGVAAADYAAPTSFAATIAGSL